MQPADIDIWTAELDRREVDLAALRQSLSPEEIERAGRFLKESDRLRFTAARGILRRLAANYLNRPPEAISFTYAERGKPSLADSGGLSFSLSHSEGRAIYAFAWDRELGIDLELSREEVDVLGIAARFFSPVEAARLESLANEEQRREFFRLWTAKEAYAKALGAGLKVIEHEPDADPRFRVEEIELGAEEFAALAYSGEKATLRFFNFTAVNF